MRSGRRRRCAPPSGPRSRAGGRPARRRRRGARGTACPARPGGTRLRPARRTRPRGRAGRRRAGTRGGSTRRVSRSSAAWRSTMAAPAPSRSSTGYRSRSTRPAGSSTGRAYAPPIGHAPAVRYRRMPIEVESPEQLGYDTITNNLSESSVSDRRLRDLGLDVDLDELLLCYGDHLGDPMLREAVAAGGDGLSPGRRAGHRRRRRRAVLRRHLAPRARRPCRRRPHQLRHEPRDATGDRCRRRRGGPPLRRWVAARRGAGRRAGAGRPDPAHQRHPAPQPHRHDVRPRHPRRARRAGRALRGDPARRRDVPRPHPRRAAAPGGHPVAARRSASRRCRRPTAFPGCASAGW